MYYQTDKKILFAFIFGVILMALPVGMQGQTIDSLRSYLKERSRNHHIVELDSGQAYQVSEPSVVGSIKKKFLDLLGITDRYRIEQCRRYFILDVLHLSDEYCSLLVGLCADYEMVIELVNIGKNDAISSSLVYQSDRTSELTSSITPDCILSTITSNGSCVIAGCTIDKWGEITQAPFYRERYTLKGGYVLHESTCTLGEQTAYMFSLEGKNEAMIIAQGSCKEKGGASCPGYGEVDTSQYVGLLTSLNDDRQCISLYDKESGAEVLKNHLFVDFTDKRGEILLCYDETPESNPDGHMMLIDFERGTFATITPGIFLAESEEAQPGWFESAKIETVTDKAITLNVQVEGRAGEVNIARECMEHWVPVVK